MKKLFYVAMVGLLVTVFSVARPVGAQAKPFSNASLVGSYSGSFEGLDWFTVPAGTSSFKEDFAGTQLETYDGSGHFTGTETLVVGITFSAASQQTCTYSDSGTYVVNPDGSGQVSYTSTLTSGTCASSLTVTSTFALFDKGNGIHAVVTSISIPPAEGTINSDVVSGTSNKL